MNTCGYAGCTRSITTTGAIIDPDGHPVRVQVCDEHSKDKRFKPDTPDTFTPFEDENFKA